MKTILFGLLLIIFSGCSTIQSVSVTSFQPNNETMVKAFDRGVSFLGVTLPNLEVAKKLKDQCPNGAVNGVKTTLVSQNVILFQAYELTAIGYCTKK